MRIIKDRQIRDDDWHVLPVEGELPEGGDYLVGMNIWNSGAPDRKRDGKLGLVLRPGDDVAAVQNLTNAPLIAIEFPKFTDGRGYSIARLLRDRYGYRGELRAVGNVLRDQLLYMQRCGFTEFALQPGKDVAGALEAFDELPVRYQADSDLKEPLFRRVNRGA